MRRDKTKSRLSIIATVASIAMILIYWLAPADEKSHPLYTLFIDCIPDSLVVLITIPIVYWLLYTRGLTNMGDCPLFSGHSPAERGSGQSHHVHPFRNSTHRPLTKDAADHHDSHVGQDLLCVILLQDNSSQGLTADRVMGPLNTTLRLAETREMAVIFTMFGLPTEHPSIEKGAASQAAGATTNTLRVELPHGLYTPPGSAVFNFFAPPQTLESSVSQNAALDMLLAAPRVREVYVAGMTSGYCFEQICRTALQHNKRTVALENSIAMIEDNTEKSRKIWEDLTAEGLVRQSALS